MILRTRHNLQSGQTLIETIAAIFILTTSLTAALALTIYVLGNSGKSLNEIVATNLAREGTNMVRNMRDTNWLESEVNGGPWALTNCTIGATTFSCYPRAWQGVPGNGFHHYDLSGPAAVTQNFQVVYNGAGANSWDLNQNPQSYALYLQADGSYTPTPTGSPAVYYRKVTLTHNINAPYANDAGQDLSELVVTSVVGWTGKGCTAMVNDDPANTNCNVTVTEHLTNWKDY